MPKIMVCDFLLEVCQPTASSHSLPITTPFQDCTVEAKSRMRGPSPKLVFAGRLYGRLHSSSNLPAQRQSTGKSEGLDQYCTSGHSSLS